MVDYQQLRRPATRRVDGASHRPDLAMKKTTILLIAIAPIGLLFFTVGSSSTALHFLQGLLTASSLLALFVIQPLMQKNQKLRSDLEEEIYYSEFDWYRKERQERHQKEYDALLEKQK